jgi:hypothetical protein
LNPLLDFVVALILMANQLVDDSFRSMPKPEVKQVLVGLEAREVLGLSLGRERSKSVPKHLNDNFLLSFHTSSLEK